jgi:GAF domain-containing protein
MEWSRSIKVRRTIFGVLFGLLFPIAGTLIEIWTMGAPFNGSTLLLAQKQNIVLLVVDTAPIVLGFLFYMIGQRETTLQESNRRMQEALQTSKETQDTLEQHVAERTRELEDETVRVRSAAEVARDIASAPSLDELLERASTLIMERFKFDHTAIFLLDDKKEYAVLRASPTEAGGQYLANNHRLRVGEQGIVGRVAATGQARIALDTGADAVYFNNPTLPNIHSEMALPLKTETEVLGVLDIQSNQAQAFRQEDIEIMQITADQLAIGIERIRLLQQVKTQLQEIERAYQYVTRQSWVSFVSDKSRNMGYKFKGAQLQPIRTVPEPAVTNPAGKEPEDKKETKIPVQLRGQTIGFVDVRFQDESTHAEIVTIIEQITERLATALDNARLAEEIRDHAQRDALISELGGRFRSSLDLESVLRTAAQEFQKAFQLQEAEVQLNIPDGTEQTDAKPKKKERKNGSSHE